MEQKIRNLTFIVIFGFAIMFALIIGLYFKDGKTTTNENNTETKTTETEYDVSKMKTVTGEEATKLFDEKGTHVLYIGRSTCSVCVNLVPELNQAQSDLDIKMNYLALESSFRTDFGDLFEHLTIETTVNGNEGTYGELLKQYGYTPIVIVIKDGKMVDGFIGYRDSDTIVDLIKEYI